MTIAAFLLVFGILGALVGVLLTDVYKRGSTSYRVCRSLAVIGVIAVGVGVLLTLSEGLGPTVSNECEQKGGIYVQNTCIDLNKLPTIDVGE